MQLSAILSEIQALGYGTDTATQQTQFVNAIYHEVCGLARWPFLEKQDATLVTVAGTASYTLPMSDWRDLDAVRISIPTISQYNNLQYIQPQDYRNFFHIDRDQSTPIYWTFMNQLLNFYPVPDSVYTVTIDYIYNPPDLAASTDVPVLPLVYHDVLVYGAAALQAFRSRDWLGRDFANEKYEATLMRMKQEFFLRQRQNSSRVKKSGFHATQLPYPFVQEGF